MSSSYIRAQDRKRNLAAALSTACLYALAFLGAVIIGSLTPVHLASVPGTVIVDLGGSDGAVAEVPQGLLDAPLRPVGVAGAAPLPAASSEPAAPSAPVPESGPATPSKVAAIPAPAPAPKAAPKAAPLPKAAPVPVPKPVPKPAAKTAPKAAPSTAKTIPEKDAAAKEAEEKAVADAAQAAAAQQAAQTAAADASAAALAAEKAAPPKTRTFGSGSGTSPAPVSSGGSGSSPGIAGGTGSVTFRGSEMGSALATTFGASQGLVGRNLYEPIWMYMPLPKAIGDSIYRNIQAKETFRSFYEQSGSDWKLKKQIPVAQRSEVWNMLDSAGFDASTADFRTERKLSSVTLEFAVGPPSKGRVELVEVRLVSSSGSSEVDEAVIYGFKRGAYFNKTPNAVGGKFVYGF